MHANRLVLSMLICCAAAAGEATNLQQITVSDGVFNTVEARYFSDGESLCFARGPVQQKAIYCVAANASQLADRVSPSGSRNFDLRPTDRELYFTSRTADVSRVYRVGATATGTAEGFGVVPSGGASVSDWVLLEDRDQAVFGLTSPQGGSVFVVNSSGPPSILPLATNLTLSTPGFLPTSEGDRIVIRNTRLISAPLSGAAATQLTTVGSILSNESSQFVADGRVYWLAGGSGNSDVRAYFAPLTGGGLPTLMNLQGQISSTYALRVSDNGRFACFVEITSGTGRLTCRDFSGSGMTRDIGLYQDIFQLAVLNYFFLDDERTLIGTTFLNGTISLIQAAADQTDSIQALTGPAMVVQTNTAQFIPETGKIVFQGAFGGELTWYALAPGSVDAVELISEPESEENIEFLGYSGGADRYVFIYDANPLPSVQRQIVAVTQDGMERRDISSSPFQNALELDSLARPKFSADGRSIIYGDSFKPFMSPRLTRIIRADLVTGARTILASFPTPVTQARGLLHLAVSPSDPDGTFVEVEDIPGGNTAAYVTYSGAPAPLFADRFEP